MSLVGRSLISLNNWSLNEVQDLFSQSRQFKQNPEQSLFNSAGKLVSLAFFEPSTRTKLSFQTALGRLGVLSSDLGPLSDSSMVKGESFSETLKTIEAMQPDLTILRVNATAGEYDTIKDCSMPIINAGCGATGHPTQALTDVYTMSERLSVEGLKVLFVGDVNHSRVVKSNIELLKKFSGISFGFCGPEAFLPPANEYKNSTLFSSLEEALSWCNICMGLRVQKERHSKEEFSTAQYQKNYRLTAEKIEKHLSKDAFIMHPGPHVPEMDFDPLIFNDPRCLVRNQVSNGVYIRMALIASILGLQEGV